MARVRAGRPAPLAGGGDWPAGGDPGRRRRSGLRPQVGEREGEGERNSKRKEKKKNKKKKKKKEERWWRGGGRPPARGAAAAAAAPAEGVAVARRPGARPQAWVRAWVRRPSGERERE